MNSKLFQMDANSVFLHGYTYEEVVVDQPLGFINLTFPNHVFKELLLIVLLHIYRPCYRQ